MFCSLRLSIVRTSLKKSLCPGHPVCRFNIAPRDDCTVAILGIGLKYSVSVHCRCQDLEPFQITIVTINDNIIIFSITACTLVQMRGHTYVQRIKRRVGLIVYITRSSPHVCRFLCWMRSNSVETLCWARPSWTWRTDGSVISGNSSVCRKAPSLFLLSLPHLPIVRIQRNPMLPRNSLGLPLETPTRYRPKPVEMRALLTPG